MTTLIFPGQGSQYVNMARDFFDNFSIARETLELIEDTTKIKLKEIIFENPSDLLNQTEFTQISIFACSISIYKVLESEINVEDLRISTMLGHSLGEYSALTAAGFLKIQDCSNLLKIRGKLMQNAYEPNKSGMAAVIGLDCNAVDKIILNNSLDVEIANDNSPQQIVISGKIDDINRSEEFFKKFGAKRFLKLNVSAAFHSNLMKIAQNQLIEHINKIDLNNSKISIISNFKGDISKDNYEIINNLKNQMSNRVRWVESIRKLESIKEKNIIEIGPGKVLSGLVKRISNNFNIKNIEVVSDLEKINNAI